jgi:hypothetical protein
VSFLVVVTEDFVSILYFDKLVGVSSLVWMVFFGQVSIGAFDVVRRSGARDAENRVKV